MDKHTMKTDDFFPLLRQTILDAFKVDSALMHAPYTDTDYEKMDMGLRRMVWGDYKTNSPIFSLSPTSPYQIVVLESSLGFYNVIATLSDESSPDLLCIMPFRDEPINQAGIHRLIRDNGIAPVHTAELTRFYLSLPIIDIDTLTLTIKHFVSFFIPEFSECSTDYVNYKSEHHTSNPSEERFQKFSSDYIEELHLRLEKCCRAMTAGKTSIAIDEMKSVMDFSTSFQKLSVSETKRELSALNVFLVSRMFETAVHPAYVFRQSEAFELKIKEAGSQRDFAHLPFDMARKYSMLAKNYTYEKYSYLIRNVINYIDQHLSADLSLSVLAEEFDKNPSYLSNAFKKEVGETLTSYIGKQRIQASLRYFNTTDMSVAEVAASVGIADFGYFSKLFKKYVGVSPRAYKKMLDK